MRSEPPCAAWASYPHGNKQPWSPLR
jgi:hypothetical protein